MGTRRRLAKKALSSTPLLMRVLTAELGSAKLDLKEREVKELAFHLSEVVVDVVRFIGSEKIDAAEQLCMDVCVHWPYHESRIRRLMRQNWRRQEAKEHMGEGASSSRRATPKSR